MSDALLQSSFASTCSAAELLCAVQPLAHAEGPGDSRIQLGIRILQENMGRYPEEASKMIFQARNLGPLLDHIRGYRERRRLTTQP